MQQVLISSELKFTILGEINSMEIHSRVLENIIELPISEKKGLGKQEVPPHQKLDQAFFCGLVFLKQSFFM